MEKNSTYVAVFVAVLLAVFVTVWFLAGGCAASSSADCACAACCAQPRDACAAPAPCAPAPCAPAPCAPAAHCARAAMPCGFSGSSAWPLSGDCFGRPKSYTTVIAAAGCC